MGVRVASSVAIASGLLRGATSPIVVVAVHDAYDDAVRCYDSILKHTPTDVALLVIDDASIDRRVVSVLEARADRIDHNVVILCLDTNHGFVGACNIAFEITHPNDVVLVNSDVVVGPEWLERLRSAATSDSSIATASALSNHGSILSVPHRNEPRSTLPPTLSIDAASQRVASASRQTRPTIPTAIGHCMYVRRTALDLVGVFDTQFAPGYGEEVDFSQRAIAHGYRNICADDVFVFHRGNASFSGTPGARAIKAEHDHLIEVRYPYYQRSVACALSDLRSPLADALWRARRALLGLTVGVDARLLAEAATGSHRVVLESIRALTRHPAVVEVSAFVPAPMNPEIAQILAGIDKLALHEVRSLAGDRSPLVDVMYRPYQVRTSTELRWLRSVGHRLVVNQLDLIAFNHPGIFEHVDDWIGYRDVTREMGTVADGVAFLSESVADHARREQIVPVGTPIRVVGCGIEHASGSEHDERPPKALASTPSGFVLVLGAPFAHKNRPFAIEVWKELRNRGFTLPLVLAGPTPTHGTSIADESRIGLDDADAARHVIDVGAVSESEKGWLFRNAGLVLYPTAIEGFGLVPFEAALFDTPTLSTRQASLDEILPEAIPTITTWDIAATADAAWELLHDAVEAERVCLEIRAAARRFTWDRTADELIELMNEVLARPSRRALANEGESAWEAQSTSDPALGGPIRPLGKLLDFLATRSANNLGLNRFFPHGSSRRQRVSRAVQRVRARC